MKTARLKLAEWIFNKLLRPFERVVIAQKALAVHANVPEVRDSYERAFGTNAKNRTVKQWKNLVRVYGIETVSKVENISPENVQMKCLPFTEQYKMKMRKSSV
jgi:hypothetical protein